MVKGKRIKKSLHRRLVRYFFELWCRVPPGKFEPATETCVLGCLAVNRVLITPLRSGGFTTKKSYTVSLYSPVYDAENSTLSHNVLMMVKKKSARTSRPEVAKQI